MDDFESRLPYRQGIIAEGYVEDVYNNAGLQSIPSERGLNKKGDICHHQDMTYSEVKADLALNKRTGLNSKNHFVEFMCNGTPSGIASTLAKRWVVVDREDAYFIYTKRLAGLLIGLSPVPSTGAEGQNIQGYLVEKKDIETKSFLVMKGHGLIFPYE